MTAEELTVVGVYIGRLERQTRTLLRYAKLAWTLCGERSDTDKED